MTRFLTALALGGSIAAYIAGHVQFPSACLLWIAYAIASKKTTVYVNTRRDDGYLRREHASV
jgi:hypothetical protein